jgi:osmotically-inducible protein OsmY
MGLTLAAIIIMGGWVVLIVAAGLVMSLRPGGVAVQLAGAPASTMLGERDEILLGGEAEVFGNVRGRVRAVLLGPDNHQLQDVALMNGLDERTVPASAVLSADGQVLRLREGWSDDDPIETEAKAATLRENATVVNAEGKRLGKLRLVCFDPASRQVTALVVEGKGTPPQRMVPLSRVNAAGPDRVVTDLKAGEWTSLPAFATDWQIRQGILERLAMDPELALLSRSLRVEVQDQRVGLHGYAANRAQADRLAQVVRSIPGVLNLDLDVLTDEDVARAVSVALERDPSTAAAHVQLGAHHGTVDITGEAPDRATIRKIDAVASRVPGVQVVHNMVGLRASAARP